MFNIISNFKSKPKSLNFNQTLSKINNKVFIQSDLFKQKMY